MPQFCVLVLGGYGMFGRRVATALRRDPDIDLVIAGRDRSQAEEWAAQLGARFAAFDVRHALPENLQRLKPRLVINCCGPFQGQNYDVARTCIEQGCHYIDLADGRDYVANFTQLHDLAVRHGVQAVTGASSVPAISSAVLDHFAAHEFSIMETIDVGITPGNQTERGVATVAAILSYVGKPFTTLIDGRMQPVIGWQNLHVRRYPVFGKRWLVNCDIPDLVLFPARYPTVRTIRFYAGLELPILTFGLWLLSWLVRWRWVASWQPYADLLRRMSLWFYRFGTDTGGMHVAVSGRDKTGEALTRIFYLIARNGDGPHIPATPSVVLAKHMRTGDPTPDAFACVGLLSLKDILHALKPYTITSEIA